jgi:hypothetical protein
MEELKVDLRAKHDDEIGQSLGKINELLYFIAALLVEQTQKKTEPHKK